MKCIDSQNGGLTLRFLCLSAAAFCSVIGCFDGDTGNAPASTPLGQPPADPSQASVTNSMSTPFIMPAVTSPANYAADQVNLPDDTPVIGVVDGDQSRAYLPSAMTQIGAHVVNDSLGSKHIAVTYCDRTDRVRVFCSTKDEPTSLQVGGFTDKEMALRLDGKMYNHSSSEIPLADLKFTRTTWRDWKTSHPSTGIFLGDKAKEFLIEPADSISN